MTDIERVISRLQIIHTWATVDGQSGRGIDPKSCAKIVEWVDDALELLKQPTIDRWISVKDRLPEIDERVLVFGVGKYEHFVGSTMTAITCMSDANLIDCRLETQPYWLEPRQYYLTDYEITHWMPLPEPPKEAERHAEL